VKKSISVPYKKENLEFDMFTRPLWDWCFELLSKPKIVSKFMWDAKWHYKLMVRNIKGLSANIGLGKIGGRLRYAI